MNSPMQPTSPERWFGAACFRTLHQSAEYDLQESVQPAGEQTPLHRHTYSEHLFIVAGEAEAWIDDRHLRLGPGDSVTIPVGAAHTVRTGADGARGVVSSRPGRFAAFIAAVGTAEPAAPDLEAVAREAAKIGDELLGPPGALPDGA